MADKERAKASAEAAKHSAQGDKAAGGDSDEDDDDDGDGDGDGDPAIGGTNTNHWVLGSRTWGISDSVKYDDAMGVPEVDGLLRDFIANAFPEGELGRQSVIKVRRMRDQNTGRQTDAIQVEAYKKLEVEYQSRVDWKAARDILRCNPSFHDHPRYDCAIVNYDSPTLHFACIRGLLRCKLPSGTCTDVALIRPFKMLSCRRGGYAARNLAYRVARTRFTPCTCPRQEYPPKGQGRSTLLSYRLPRQRHVLASFEYVE